MKYSIQDVLSDEKVRKEIITKLTQILIYLKFDSVLAKKYAEIAVTVSKEQGAAYAERYLHNEFEKLGLTKVILDSFKGRAELIYSQVKPYVYGTDVLDLGSGDGKVGELIANDGKNVMLVDVLDFNQTSLPFTTFNGVDLPYGDKSFDTTILLTVLHHADEPLKVLQEAKRVTRGKIIVLESVYFDEDHRKVNTFFDWFWNRVLHQGINAPFNFNSPTGWEEVFKENGLTVEHSIDLGVDQPTVPEHHWLYVLKV